MPNCLCISIVFYIFVLILNKETSIMISLAESISKMPLFKDCNYSTIEKVCNSTFHRLRKKDKDTYIAHMNDECNFLLILVEGSIYSSMTNSDGKEVVLETITGPLVLAPAFVFAKINRFPVNVVTRTECTFMYVDKEVFAEMLNDDRQLMMNYIGVISDRCYRLSLHVNQTTLLTLKQRVIEYLEVNKRIDSVQWLSRLLGVTRPSLSRVLSELKAENIINRTLDGLELVEQK